MANKSFAIRLYHFHDKDLITLLENYKFNITQAAYTSLTSFINKENILIPVTEKRDEPKEIKYSCTKYLALNEDNPNDLKILNLLNKIKPGYRNMFIKNVLRCSLMRPVSEIYFDNSNDYEELSSHCEFYKDEKRVINLKMSKKFKKDEVDCLLKSNKNSFGNDNEKKETVSTFLEETEKNEKDTILLTDVKSFTSTESIIEEARSISTKQILADMPLSYEEEIDEDINEDIYEEELEDESAEMNDAMNSLF